MLKFMIQKACDAKDAFCRVNTPDASAVLDVIST